MTHLVPQHTPRPITLVLHHIFQRANGPNATFADMVDVVRITADWSVATTTEVLVVEDLLRRFGARLDQLGLKPASASRADLHAAVTDFTSAHPEARQAARDLADLLLLAAGRRQGEYQ